MALSPGERMFTVAGSAGGLHKKGAAAGSAKTPKARRLAFGACPCSSHWRAASLGGVSEKDLLAESPRQGQGAQPEGARKKGKVLSVHGADVFVDVPGGRSQGVLPIAQFPDGPPKPGTEVEFEIEGYDRANGLLLLSRRGAAVIADWSSVAEGMIVEARVTETNKGVLAVDVNGIRGFMPVSQIDLYRVENTEQFVNQRLRCVVTEVDRQERNLVVSRRALLEKEREEQRE